MRDIAAKPFCQGEPGAMGLSRMCDPVRGRMGCDVDPDKVSAGQPNDDKGIEQVEANGRNNEQVHGGDVRRVVTQEGAPALGRRSTSLDHVLRDARLSDLKAELE